MILLDTNVVSEMMRRMTAPTVMAFLRSRRTADLFLPSLAVAEIRYGIARLPAGARRASLQSEFNAVRAGGFEGRIIAFDAACAAAYGQARAARERIGRPAPATDGLIGGIALAHGAMLQPATLPTPTDMAWHLSIRGTLPDRKAGNAVRSDARRMADCWYGNRARLASGGTA